MAAAARRRKYYSREQAMIDKREKEFQYQKFWNDRQKYYEHWDKSNNRYEAWTSPRYYEENDKLRKELMVEKYATENRERRRKKLRELLEAEHRSYDVEMMTARNNEKISPRQKPGEIPLEILRDIHSGFKEKEQEQRRQEAETRLYQQWRENNPVLRDYERRYRTKDLKMSWLNQQVEKRMKQEREEEERKKFLEERDERLKLENLKDEEYNQAMERRNRELKQAIDKQIEELKLRQEISERLKARDEEESRQKSELGKLDEDFRDFERAKRDKETALFNVRLYKTKIKKKLDDIRDNLMREEDIMSRLKQMEIAEKIEDDKIKREVVQGINDFLEIAKQQKQLEKLRERQLQFLFDSEAEQVYKRQSAIWREEEEARNCLIKDVLETVGRQIEYNRQKTLEEQKDLVRERETLIRMTEEYNEELRKSNEEEERRKMMRKKELDMEVKSKWDMRRSEAHDARLKDITAELEKTRVEEERLKREILNLHRGQGVFRPSGRSNIFL